MLKNNNDVNVHIVHSMKGGCGKSACSLFKVLQYACQSEKIEYPAKVLFLDADFRGSALQWLLFEDSRGKKANYNVLMSQLRDIHFLNDSLGDKITHYFALPGDFSVEKNLNQYIKGHYETFEQILNHSASYHGIKESMEDEGSADGTAELGNDKFFINGFFDIIFSSYRSNDKELFRYSSHEGTYRMPAITSGVYTYHIEQLLKQMLKHGQADSDCRGQYEHIVIDMPPGYDEYSDLLLQELRKMAEVNSNIKLHYYSVTTNDIGHMCLALQNVQDMIKSHNRFAPFESVNVILNCMAENDFLFGLNSEPDFDMKISEILKTLSGKGEVLKKSYEQGYRKFCRSSETLYFMLTDTRNVFTQIKLEGDKPVEKKGGIK